MLYPTSAWISAVCGSSIVAILMALKINWMSVQGINTLNDFVNQKLFSETTDATASLIACSLVLVLFLLAALEILRWRRRTFRYFEKLGIPGPKPNILWGNLWEYHSKGITTAIAEWSEKYGDVFGFYNGDVPTLVVKDLDFLSYVLVKNFANFVNRGTTMASDQQHPLLSKGVLHARDQQWKRTRSVISYAFTATKFRQVFSHLDEVCDRFLDILSEKDAKGMKEVDAYALFNLLTMEYICGGSFGIANKFQQDPEHPFFRAATKAGKQDILQVLLDAESGTETTDSGVTEGRFHVEKKLSTPEISINTAMLLVAGFGTTSVALSFVCYMLAKHPDVQEKVRQEVKRVRAKYGSLDYTAVTQGLKYLACVVDETLRVYPVVVSFITRTAREDFEYKGVRYKAGLNIMSLTLLVHKDPAAWSELERFDPDRFLPENVALQHGMAYQPFGQGPRNCVGKRLALVEIIYTVGRIVERFRLQPGPSQKEKLELRFYSMACEPREGPWIKFSRIPAEA